MVQVLVLDKQSFLDNVEYDDCLQIIGVNQDPKSKDKIPLGSPKMIIFIIESTNLHLFP